MVIGDLNAVRSTITPKETQPPLVIDPNAVLAFSVAVDLMEQAVLIESVPNRKTADKPSIDSYHRFYVPVWDGKAVHTIRIVAEQSKEGIRVDPGAFDIYELVQKHPGEAAHGHQQIKDQTAPLVASFPREVSIRQMLNGVKGDDGKPYFQSPGNVITDLKQGGRAKTDTAAFKQWFGDSKVVDDQGKGTNPSISPDIASAIGRESAPIRLQKGDEKSGLMHIEAHHGDQARALGYANAREMVEDITLNFDAIYAGRGRALILAKRTPVRGQAYVQLEPSEDGAVYDVKTATPSREDQFKNRRPLWERAGPSTSTAEAATVDPSIQSGDEIISDREKTNNQNHPGHGIRGSYQRSRDPYGDISNWITFTKDADRSTFIHESGHFWLFQLIIDAFGLRDRINL